MFLYSRYKISLTLKSTQLKIENRRGELKIVTETSETMAVQKTTYLKYIYICCLLLMLVGCVQPAYQEYDIYSGEHLDDTIMKTDGSGVTNINAVLVVYDDSCEDFIEDYRIHRHPLPLTKYVVFLYHEYVTSQTNTWYGYNGDDIKERYDITTCWAVLFIPEGSRRDSEPRRWTPEIGRDFTDWVWDQIRYPIEITNYNNFRVKLEVIGGYGHLHGPDQFEPIGLDPSEKRIEMIPLSYFVTAHTWDQMSDGRHYIGAWKVDHPKRKIPVLSQPRDDADYHADIQNYMDQESLDDYTKREWIWTGQQRHLLNLKQPLVTPNLTETGFLKRQIPSEWYEKLVYFYRTNQAHRIVENWPHIDSVVNHDEIATTIIPLSEHVKQTVSRGLQDLMEEWCGVQLEMTSFYGIREYYRGNILRNHVDRVETHVISAILQVEQDLGEGESWPLEFIDYSGDRQEVMLKPGEMLLYESAKLIHGRPKTFTGNLFANVFLHYKPLSSWTETHFRSGLTLHYPQDKRERLLPFKSNLTQQHARRRKLFAPYAPDNQINSEAGKIEL